MAHSKQASKRVRQTEKERLANKARMSRMKSAMKGLQAAINAGDKGKAAAMLPTVCQVIDKAAQTRVIHAHKADRHKGQVMRAVAAMA